MGCLMFVMMHSYCFDEVKGGGFGISIYFRPVLVYFFVHCIIILLSFPVFIRMFQ